jgi:hypothetical protein
MPAVYSHLLVYVATAEHSCTEFSNWCSERECGEMGKTDNFLENVVKFQTFGDWYL